MYLIAKVDESGTRLSFRIDVSRESTFEPPKSQSKPKIYQLILEKSKVESFTGKLGHFFKISHQPYYKTGEKVEPSLHPREALKRTSE